MIQFILMLLGLAFGNHNASTSSCNNDNNGQITILLTEDPGGSTDPGTGTGEDGGPGNGGSTGGNTGQTPPPITQP